MRQLIQTENAPAAIGNYSPAIKVDKTVYICGQIALEPKTGEFVSGDISIQAVRVFDNLKAVAIAAGGSLNDVVKLSVFLVNLADLVIVNELITHYFKAPFPARTTIQVSALPKNAIVEIDAIMVLSANNDDA